MQHDRGATVREVLSAVSGQCPAVSEYSVSVETRNRILPSPHSCGASSQLQVPTCQSVTAGATFSSAAGSLQCPHRLQSGRDLHDGGCVWWLST